MTGSGTGATTRGHTRELPLPIPALGSHAPTAESPNTAHNTCGGHRALASATRAARGRRDTPQHCVGWGTAVPDKGYRASAF